MEGIVVAISYGVYSVLVDGVIYKTSPKGLFRLSKNKITVGDHVLIDPNNYIIQDVLIRNSLLKRPSIANVDQIFLVFSLKEPDFSYYLAAKYLTYAHYQGVKASLVLTKKDKADEEDIKKIKEVFENVGVNVHVLSNKTKEGVEEVRNLFANKVTCLVGQTGAGKSSLINSIDPTYEREIGEYSEALGRGKHKTKEVILLPYMGGFIADTPGFSSLELDIPKVELSHHFPGMEKISLTCFYNDCLHVHEKDCQVKKAVEEGRIATILYDCYLKLIQEENL